MPNRHSCDADFEKLKSYPNPEDIIILMCDVNGLKPVNDLQGHEAGDELLQGAAYCLKKSFESLDLARKISEEAEGANKKKGYGFNKSDIADFVAACKEIDGGKLMVPALKKLIVSADTAAGYIVFDADVLSEVGLFAD